MAETVGFADGSSRTAGLGAAATGETTSRRFERMTTMTPMIMPISAAVSTALRRPNEVFRGSEDDDWRICVAANGATDEDAEGSVRRGMPFPFFARLASIA